MDARAKQGVLPRVHQKDVDIAYQIWFNDEGEEIFVVSGREQVNAEAKCGEMIIQLAPVEL